jgi:hypothetical protein
VAQDRAHRDFRESVPETEFCDPEDEKIIIRHLSAPEVEKLLARRVDMRGAGHVSDIRFGGKPRQFARNRTRRLILEGGGDA